MTCGITLRNRKKKFTIIPEVYLITTPEERQQSKEEQVVNRINAIDNIVSSHYRGPCIIEKVFLDGELIEMDYVCRNVMPSYITIRV